MKGRIGIVVLLVAIVAASAAGLYLLKVKKTVERTTTPVEVAAPDLFPADTLLFAAAHRMDESWNAAEAWWSRFEPTATCWLLKREWSRARERGSLPPGVKEGLDRFESAMAAAEARLGYRPDTKQFFETYGKYTAFGLLPAKDAGRPRMLLVVRLPGEAAMEMLRQKLGGVAKRHDPPDLHGYPVFTEEGGALGKVLYGIGGGYLFVADDAPALGGALERLSARTSGAPSPAPALSGDPVFRRAVPARWEEVGLALFVRRSQQFARWDGSLKVLDDYLAHAFVLAPGDDAIALAAVRIPGGADFSVRSSFSGEGKGEMPWADALPGGMCRAMMSAPARSPASREALLADFDAFRGKRIWKEADALLRDGPRLRRLLEEAFGPGGVPEEEVLRRLPRDVEFFSGNFREAVERAILSPASSWCFGQKTTDAGGTRLEMIAGMRFGPIETFLLAAGLDLLVDRQGEWVRKAPPPLERVSEKGFLAWRFRLDPHLEDEDLAPMLASWKGTNPSFVLADGVLWFTMGEGIYADLRGRVAGTVPPLSADPLFREAAATVPEGAVVLDYSRPSEYFRGWLEGMRSQVDPLLEAIPGSEARDLLDGLTSAFREVILWEKGVRSSMTAVYDDPSRPAETVVLLDPAAAAAWPRLSLDPAAMAAPGLLPASTCLLAEGRIDVRPAAEAFIAAFLRGLPGGRARWDELRAEIPAGKGDLEDRLDALFVDMRGEAGFAVVAPQSADPDTVKGTQDLIDRIPGFVLFAAYAHPEAAFGTVADLFESFAGSLQEQVPFETRRRMYDRGRGPRPVGFEALRTEVDGSPVALFSVSWPEGPRGGLLSAGMAVVRRGDLLFFTTSLPAATSIAGAEAGAPGTLGERMAREVPAGVLPAECSSFFLSREDGFADCVAHYARPLAPGLAGLTLRGAGGPPEPDRVKAHQEGWKEFAVLLEDLLRTGKWTVSATVKGKDRLETKTRRVQGK